MDVAHGFMKSNQLVAKHRFLKAPKPFHSQKANLPRASKNTVDSVECCSNRIPVSPKIFEKVGSHLSAKEKRISAISTPTVLKNAKTNQERL